MKLQDLLEATFYCAQVEVFYDEIKDGSLILISQGRVEDVRDALSDEEKNYPVEFININTNPVADNPYMTIIVNKEINQ